eukprot:5497403-Amphidinium_carterae.3
MPNPWYQKWGTKPYSNQAHAPLLQLGVTWDPSHDRTLLSPPNSELDRNFILTKFLQKGTDLIYCNRLQFTLFSQALSLARMGWWLPNIANIHKFIAHCL